MSNRTYPLSVLQQKPRSKGFLNDLTCSTYDPNNQRFQLATSENEEFFIIFPDSTFRLLLESISLCFILADAIIIPFFIFFHDAPQFDSTELYKELVNYYFWFTMIIEFRIGYYDKGLLVTDPVLIAKQYFKGISNSNRFFFH